MGALGALCLIQGAAMAQAPASASAPTPRIITSGSGEARVSPDKATIFIGVQSRASTAASAASTNARRQRAVLDTLRAMGLTSAQLSTVNYSVSPEMQYDQNTRTSRVVGYVVSNSVRVQVNQLDDVGRIIDAALAKGANEISSLQFESSKADSARRAALSEAVANARADAEALARAAGGTLGELIELSTTSSPIRPYAEMAMAKVAAAAPTPIEPGEQTISASVTAQWAFVHR
jgi:uncharacterized protein YggE